MAAYGAGEANIAKRKEAKNHREPGNGAQHSTRAKAQPAWDLGFAPGWIQQN